VLVCLRVSALNPGADLVQQAQNHWDCTAFANHVVIVAYPVFCFSTEIHLVTEAVVLRNRCLSSLFRSRRQKAVAGQREPRCKSMLVGQSKFVFSSKHRVPEALQGIVRDRGIAF
jgi:hypothetical protein